MHSPRHLLLLGAALVAPGCIALWGEENIELSPEVEQRVLDSEQTEQRVSELEIDYVFDGDDLVLQAKRTDVCRTLRIDRIEHSTTTVKSHDYLWLEWAAGGVGASLLGLGIVLTVTDDDGYYDEDAETFTAGGWLTTVGAAASLTLVSAVVDSIVLMDETETEEQAHQSVLSSSVCGSEPVVAPVQLLVGDRAVFFGQTEADGKVRIPIGTLAEEHSYKSWQIAVGDDEPQDIDLSEYVSWKARQPPPAPPAAPPDGGALFDGGRQDGEVAR